MEHLRSRLLFTIVMVVVVVSGQHIRAQVKIPRVSQGASVSQTVGITDVTVRYHRPGVKGRTIWGGLVPYDSVWRTGANDATTISFTDSVTVDGHGLPAGTYSLLTIPGRSQWTVVFNRDTTLFGAFDYHQADDALRITVTPQSGEHQEWMRFTFEDLSESTATVVLAWEKLRIPFTVSVATEQLTLKRASRQLNSGGPVQIANYLLSKNSRLDEAMKWVNISMMYEENYSNLRVKAQLLEKAGKKDEAIAMMERAVGLGKGMKDAPFDLGDMEKKLKEWKAR